MKNRLPVEYFTTYGNGDSDLEIHAGSYHMALFDAKIHPYNIMQYSSVLPANAKVVSKEKALKSLKYGSELYTITSCIHGVKGEYLVTGVLTGTLVGPDNKDLITLAVECSRKFTDVYEYSDFNISEYLVTVFKELQYKTFPLTTCKDYNIYGYNHYVTKKFGTCLCSLCITKYK